jgi:hypothetical protein
LCLGENTDLNSRRYVTIVTTVREVQGNLTSRKERAIEGFYFLVLAKDVHRSSKQRGDQNPDYSRSSDMYLSQAQVFESCN